ncbi:MAG: hypothetical protein K2O73_06550 [Lachnospiraceae bacterium]|nr:hypothetical protein [Lachnospiraceae bacterium]
MGFLDNLIRRETRRAVYSVVDSAVDKVVNSAKQNISNNQNNSNPNNSASAYHQSEQPVQATSASASGSGEAELRRRIEHIVATEWSGYELRSDIPASVFNAKPDAHNYSYGIYHNGVPVAMIMIIGHNRYTNRDIRHAQRACEAQNIPYMNFMHYMQNKPEYISGRFRNTIRG